MPCLCFNKAINVSFVEFEKEFTQVWVLSEPAVILREGSKAITHTGLVKYPSWVSTPLTFDLHSATGQKAKPGLVRQKNVSRTGRQRNSKHLVRTPGPTLNINKHTWDLAGCVAEWCWCSDTWLAHQLLGQPAWRHNACVVGHIGGSHWAQSLDSGWLTNSEGLFLGELYISHHQHSQASSSVQSHPQAWHTLEANKCHSMDTCLQSWTQPHCFFSGMYLRQVNSE